MTNNIFNCPCDNFDHEGELIDVQPVALREEYGGGVVDWCDECRERDCDMIVPECGDCGRLLTGDDDFISEAYNRCSRCLYQERQEV